MAKGKSKIERFLELAKPDENGISRWVDVSEFTGENIDLRFGNGASWARTSQRLAKTYFVEFGRKSLSKNSSITKIRLNGFRKNKLGSQYIRPDIKNEIKKVRCLILDTSSPVPDHKDGRKDDLTVMTASTQKLSDFQPFSDTANYAKRQHCKNCKETGKRYDAKLLGYPISVVEGKLEYEKPLGCVGCFWYDPVAFRKKLKFEDE